MIQTRAVQSLADSHRRDLMASAGPRPGVPADDAAHRSGTTPQSLDGRPAAGGLAVRRAVAPRLGAWLIEFGTKLGGATIRTS
jgi:hypothetical protein